MDFDGFTAVWSEIFRDVNLFNSQKIFYQAYGDCVTTGQTAFIDISAASQIRAKMRSVYFSRPLTMALAPDPDPILIS